MGTGAFCLCLWALKWPVPALCSGWPQNSPDLLVATGRWHRFFWERPRPCFQPHSRCHKHRKDIWGNLANQWSLGTSTLWVNTHSGLIWIWVSPSISWKSFLYHWERCRRSGQSGQLACRWVRGFVFTLHRVGLSSCESLENSYTSVLHTCPHTKNSGQPDKFNAHYFYNIISHLEKVVPKDTQYYVIDRRFTCLWIHFWKWNCYVLNAGLWP